MHDHPLGAWLSEWNLNGLLALAIVTLLFPIFLAWEAIKWAWRLVGGHNIWGPEDNNGE